MRGPIDEGKKVLMTKKVWTSGGTGGAPKWWRYHKRGERKHSKSSKES